MTAPALYRRGMPIQLVAFDLDGTVVRGGTCVEAIARAIGRSDECAQFEQLSMRDLAAVSAAREAMAEWYGSYEEQELTAGLADLTLAPGADEAFALLRARGVRTAIVSITWSFAVEHFAKRFGVDFHTGTRLTAKGIEHVWPHDKGAWLRALMVKLGLERVAVAAVGDSDGDRELLLSAGTRVFVGAHPLEGIPDLVHIADADLREVAELLLAR
jgi:phosphoserine phosphatase